MRTAFSLFLLLAVATSAIAQQTGQSSSAAPAGATQASETYQIVPLDVLTFKIVGEPDTETSIRVAADGRVTLPYVGTVEVAGLTVSEARQYLYDRYNADFFVNPQVYLAVTGYKQRRVNVQGMVNQQGFVIFPPEEEVTLLGAIALAGGWSNNRLADRGRVKLVRKLPNGETVEHEIDCTKISQTDWPLHDGDYIIVPERKW